MNREGGGQGNPQAQAACASCKHQRKRCDSTCELAPYFPASKYREFQNAHKLFGVSNIQKILNAVEPEQRTAAAESLLLEGTFRREDPVYGSFGIVCKLESELDLCKQELYAVNRQLAYFKEREQLLQQKEQLEGILEVESSLSLNKIFSTQGSCRWLPNYRLVSRSRRRLFGDQERNIMKIGHGMTMGFLLD
ncbi:hypothetical protein VitviT2T_016363 [Vitis vinifera]|uniref:LOB domain-containing protein n=1 Tax=Vitis vinifera TaxID=29760 RepID=A0ABY9CRR2_VITVI|nr:hypothetical protein VitviT2T_016363 [Vitis vinifera]